MIGLKQTILSDKEKGILGNCMTAAIASLLEVEIDYVPYFCYGNPSDLEFYSRLNDWFAGIGISHMELKAEGDALLMVKSVKYHLVYGVTDRHETVQHAVIGSAGEIVFDPHPSNDGLKEVYSYGFCVIQDIAAFSRWQWFVDDQKKRKAGRIARNKKSLSQITAEHLD